MAKKRNRKFWVRMGDLREFFLGGTSELTGQTGALAMHHVWTKEFGLGDKNTFEYKGKVCCNDESSRNYTIYDGQLRLALEEADMHFFYYGGNSERSLTLHEKQNKRLLWKLRQHVFNSKQLFNAETEEAIRGWIDFYPAWIQEFRTQRNKLNYEELIIPHSEKKVETRFNKSVPWWCWGDFTPART